MNDSFSQRSFSLSTIEKKDVDDEISKLYSSKAIQNTDIAVEILKKNGDFFQTIFTYFLMKQFVYLNFYSL